MGFFNVKFPTLGGQVFWDTLDTRNGYKLQKNSVTGHYRILDDNDWREWWGSSYSEAKREFRDLSE